MLYLPTHETGVCCSRTGKDEFLEGGRGGVRNLGACVHVRASRPTHKCIRTHHMPPRGCDCSRSDLYVRVSAYTFVHTHTGTTCTSARKHLPSALGNIRHVEKSIILPSRKTREDACFSFISSPAHTSDRHL